jgi:hypothetical protein
MSLTSEVATWFLPGHLLVYLCNLPVMSLAMILEEFAVFCEQTEKYWMHNILIQLASYLFIFQY